MSKQKYDPTDGTAKKRREFSGTPRGGGGLKLWIHGHTHATADYYVGGTRVIANPHGYGLENRDFDPTLIVEVGS